MATSIKDKFQARITASYNPDDDLAVSTVIFLKRGFQNSPKNSRRGKKKANSERAVYQKDNA